MSGKKSSGPAPAAPAPDVTADASAPPAEKPKGAGKKPGRPGVVADDPLRGLSGNAKGARGITGRKKEKK